MTDPTDTRFWLPSWPEPPEEPRPVKTIETPPQTAPQPRPLWPRISLLRPLFTPWKKADR